jgi:hypothetical protein
MRRPAILILCSVLIIGAIGGPAPAGGAGAFAHPRFHTLWAATDEVVASGAVQRAWVWGPEPADAGRQEPYSEAPGGQRLVQYFDKGRMELTTPDGAVTSGLLAREMMTGRVQIGDGRFEERTPSSIGVAGDPDDTLGPTYAILGRLMSRPPQEFGTALVETVDRDGSVGADLALSRYGARAEELIPQTNHRVANVFRLYFEGQPLPNTEGDPPDVAPFAPWYTVTGLPITEAHWARVRVGLFVRDVLVQAFERRVLTYTPANPPGSRVEMGNVGRHYLDWRTGLPPAPVVAGLPCPTFPEPPKPGKGDDPWVILGSAVHNVAGRRFITGSIRNEGNTSGSVEVRITTLNSAGATLSRYSAFTDRDWWPNGQIAAFRTELNPAEPIADWQISIRSRRSRVTGGLVGDFRVEGLAGNVDGLGVGEIQGTVRYVGQEPFADVVLVRIHALDACGSVVGNGLASFGTTPFAPGATRPFSTLLLNVEGAVALRAVIEARSGTASFADDEALRVYEGRIFPAPVVPIVAVQGCCRYTRQYERPDGTPVRSDYRRAPA